MIAIRNEYQKVGVDEYYKENAYTYINPHEDIVHNLLDKAIENKLIGKKVLDLCCGSGEVSRHLKKIDCQIVGVDPYTYDSYQLKTGNKVLPYSFIDIALGKITEKFDTIICSFALHLCPKSLLPNLLWNLGQISNTLIVISPNKNPNCDNISNWILVDEFTSSRVKMKVYQH